MLGIIDKQKLDLALQKKGIKSTLELARLSNIHRNTLAPYINGEKSIYSNAILELASFLDIDPERLRAERSVSSDAFVAKLAESFCENFSASYPELAIVLFGSRAKGKARKFSDYDIGVSNGLNFIASSDFLKMKEFFCQQADNFAWKIDLVNLDQAPDWFLSDMTMEQTKLLSGRSETYNFLKGRAYECWKTRQARSSSE